MITTIIPIIFRCIIIMYFIYHYNFPIITQIIITSIPL